VNHIKRLQHNNKTYEKAYRAFKEAVSDFRVHLSGPKFHQDTTIQVSDVHRWLDNIVNAQREILWRELEEK